MAAKKKKKVKHVKKKPSRKPSKGKAKKRAIKRKPAKSKARPKRRKSTKPRTKQRKPAARSPRHSGQSKRSRKAAEQALQYELQAEQEQRDRRNQRRRELWAAKPEAEKEVIRAKRRAKYAAKKLAIATGVSAGPISDIRRTRKRVEVKYMNVGDIEYLNDQPQIEDSRYNLTSHFNRTTPNEITVPEVFELAFQGKLRNSGLEADEISIYKYGIVIRPGFGKVTAEIEQEIMGIMESYNIGGTIIVVHESNSVDSIHIKLGTSFDPILAGDVANAMRNIGSLFQNIWEYLDSQWDDMIWLVEWDTDELMGGSP